ncbi:MAG: MOSC N-terminal beta barrel domain-containing protein [Actinomycetes bacterium]
MRVAGLWRYPVKSMAGESIESATVTSLGIPGDRIVQVVGPEGVRTSRNHHRGYHRLLGLHGTLGPDGEPLVDGLSWSSPETLLRVREVAGSDAWLETYQGPERFDVLPLLVATDGAVAAFGRDVRRLRPNILVSGVEGLDEVTWPGAELHIGDAVVRLDSLRPRCPMTTIDPDTLERDPEVLRDIARRFGGRLALNAGVERSGTISVGDVVHLATPGTPPLEPGRRDFGRPARGDH